MKQVEHDAIGTAEDIIRGAPAIGIYIGVCQHTVMRRLRKGHLPGGFKIDNQICLSKRAYHAGIASRIAEASRRAA